jgi:hypothetical protein
MDLVDVENEGKGGEAPRGKKFGSGPVRPQAGLVLAKDQHR